jgi:uncharacterized protein
MGKLLSWVVLAALVYLAYRVLLVSKRRAERARDPAERVRDDDRRGRNGASGPARDGQADPAGERMVACAHCGVYLPASEALEAAGRSFCSAAHRDAGPR